MHKQQNGNRKSHRWRSTTRVIGRVCWTVGLVGSFVCLWRVVIFRKVKRQVKMVIKFYAIAEISQIDCRGFFILRHPVCSALNIRISCRMFNICAKCQYHLSGQGRGQSSRSKPPNWTEYLPIVIARSWFNIYSPNLAIQHKYFWHEIWPHLRQIYSQWTSVSGDIRFMQLFVGVLWRGTGNYGSWSEMSGHLGQTCYY